MQTRRDQLQAYRFLNRRALAALVTGEPDVVEPPMRRLTVTTISGIMIAVLIAVGFALFGVLKPTPGDKWKEAGAIIVERETGARYVLIDNVLHPALNYSSAVLAVGTNQTAHVVLVDRSDLKGAKRGATVGIDGIPDSLPSAKTLVKSPWTVCSRLQGAQGDQLAARASVLVGSDAAARQLPANQGVLVRGVSDGASYLLWHGQRLVIASSSVATSLGLQNADSVQVGTAFLDAVPPGTPLNAPNVPQVGTVSSMAIEGSHPVVGQLLHITDNDQSFLVLADGVAALDNVQTALLRTLPIGRGGQPLAPLNTHREHCVGPAAVTQRLDQRGRAVQRTAVHDTAAGRGERPERWRVRRLSQREQATRVCGAAEPAADVHGQHRHRIGAIAPGRGRHRHAGPGERRRRQGQQWISDGLRDRGARQEVRGDIR